MGERYDCDLCGADIPLRESIQQIIVGEEKVADACLTCGSAIASQIKKQVTEKQAASSEAAPKTEGPESVAPDAAVAKEEAGAVPPEVKTPPKGDQSAGA